MRTAPGLPGVCSEFQPAPTVDTCQCMQRGLRGELGTFPEGQPCRVWRFTPAPPAPGGAVREVRQVYPLDLPSEKLVLRNSCMLATRKLVELGPASDFRSRLCSADFPGSVPSVPGQWGDRLQALCSLHR